MAVKPAQKRQQELISPLLFDYDHLLNLLSTPLSLLIQALVTSFPHKKVYLPTNSSALLKEIVSNAMCLEISTFDLGKYIFDNQSEADMIDQILQSHISKAVNDAASSNKTHALPCLDTYMMKSNMLREVLMKVMLTTNNSKNQWDFVRETREKILSRI